MNQGFGKPLSYTSFFLNPGIHHQSVKFPCFSWSSLAIFGDPFVMFRTPGVKMHLDGKETKVEKHTKKDRPRYTWANTRGSCSKCYSKNPVHLGKERRFRCELKANHFWIKWTHQSNENSILTNRNAFTLQPFTQILSRDSLNCWICP